MATGVTVDDKRVVRLVISDVERKQIERVKKHHNIRNDKTLFMAMIKRELLKIDTKT